MIEIKGLTKCYGKNIAVNNISFNFEQGKIYGFLGPNGAGKSTTMNIMSGCLSATDGNVLVNGHDISSEPVEAKKLIGYLPETPPLYTEMTPQEYLCFVSGAKGIKRSEREQEIQRVIDSAGIASVKDRLICNLSKGYRQRVGIAQALIGQPEYIILDEPTVGLDPNQMIEIRELIRTLGKEHTVILSSHILSEVSNICDRLLIISSGEIVASGSVDELRHSLGEDIKINAVFKSTDEDGLIKIISNIEGIKSVSAASCDLNDCTSLEITSAKDIRENIFFASAEIKAAIIEMNIRKPSLEEMFIELTSFCEESTEENNDISL